MNKTKVRFPTFTEFEVTNAEYDVIHSLYNSKMPVTAIKFLRAQYGNSLRETKDICDAIGATPRPTYSY